MASDGPSRRGVVTAAGGALVAGLGLLGRRAAEARPGGIDGERDDRRRRTVDAVCYNGGSRARTLALRVVPADESDPAGVTVDLAPGASVRVADLFADPAGGTIPHEITAAVSGDGRPSETFVARRTRDLREIHVVLADGRVGIRDVRN